MTREETNKLLKQIIKDYKESYGGDFYIYECVDRDILTSVTIAFNEGKISTVQYKELVDIIMADYIRSACESVCPKIDTTGKKFHFKVEKMSNHDLRIELEDAMSKLEDIEQVYSENALCDQDKWIKLYKSEILRLFLAVKELMHRTIKLEEMILC